MEEPTARRGFSTVRIVIAGVAVVAFVAAGLIVVRLTDGVRTRHRRPRRCRTSS